MTYTTIDELLAAFPAGSEAWACRAKFAGASTMRLALEFPPTKLERVDLPGRPAFFAVVENGVPNVGKAIYPRAALGLDFSRSRQECNDEWNRQLRKCAKEIDARIERYEALKARLEKMRR